MIDLTTLSEISFNEKEVEKIEGSTLGVVWQKQADFIRMAIHSEDQQYINTGVINTGDYILEGRFRLNYIDPPNANGDGNWIVGARKDGNYTLGLFIGSAGVFNAYGRSTSPNKNQITINTWYTYKIDMDGMTLSTDDGKTTFYEHPGGSRLIPESYGVEIRICSITGNWTGTAEDMRRMWGDHDYHKCTERQTGNVLYNFEAGIDIEGIACFKNTVNGELKYSDSGNDFTPIADLLVQSRNSLSEIGIVPTLDYDENKRMLNELGVVG